MAIPFAFADKIKDGTILDSNGNVITMGYDMWGYNYQAHMFNGYYENYGRPDVPVTESTDYLQMKWNDAWLSNKDLGTQPAQAEYTAKYTPDNKLDRHYGYDSYDNSGAWLTNHETWVDGDGITQEYFVKIVTPPTALGFHKGVIANGEDAALWYAPDGTEVGQIIWGSFAVIQEYDTSISYSYMSPYSTGVGSYPAVPSASAWLE